jgi:hypothetical protein
MRQETALNPILKSLLPSRDFGWNRVRSRCGLPGCHSKLLTRAVPQSRIGLHAGEQWYCSVDCFVSAVQKPLSTLAAGRLVEMQPNPRLSIGLALLSRGCLTEEQLRFATDTSRACGENLEKTLLRLGMAGEKQLAGARAVQWGYPALVQEIPQQTIIVEFPQTLMREFSAVPLHSSAQAKKLFLGFVHRVDHRLLQAIEQVTGCRPEPCFLTPAEYEEQLQRVAAPPNYEETVIREISTPERMARNLGGIASQAGARQVALARCKSHLWARVCGKQRIVDVLFPLRNLGGAQAAASECAQREVVGSC